MENAISTIDEIKDLYSKIKKKGEFMIVLANKTGKKPNTLKNHWFSCYFGIPEEYQEITKSLLEETIKNQQNEKSN